MEERERERWGIFHNLILGPKEYSGKEYFIPHTKYSIDLESKPFSANLIFDVDIN